MTRGFLRQIAWLFTGAVITGALYWTLVNTPDSNVLMLTGSALVVLGIIAVGATTVGGAVHLARGGQWSRGMLRTGLATLPRFVVSLAPMLLVAWLSGRAMSWLDAHGGETSAWFIARLGWADVSWLIAGAEWALAWVRWIAGPWLGLTLFVAVTDPGRQAGVFRGWAAAACRWRPLALATLWFIVLIALPWRLAVWRPGGLPPTWVEPALAGLRLILVALAMATGAALIVREAASRAGGTEVKVSE